jgi:DNA-binding NarL/FixJ family response regulator
VTVKGKSVVVFDPSPLWLNAVEEALSANGAKVVGLAREQERALALIEEHKPALLVADPAEAGIGIIREARAGDPGLKVVALGAPADAGEVSAVLAAGAAAFVVKAEPVDSFGAEADEESVSPPVPGGRERAEARLTSAA